MSDEDLEVIVRRADGTIERIAAVFEDRQDGVVSISMPTVTLHPGDGITWPVQEMLSRFVSYD